MDIWSDIPIIAVDGGGTRCRIATATGDKVDSVESGPANASTDLAGAAAQIGRGIEQLADRLRISERELVTRPAFVGVAGVTGPAIAERLRTALPFPQIRIEDDRPAAVRGALGQRAGVIAHCGTGSFFGGQFGGEMRLAGGWGSVLGDEASAQWVGRTALRLTLETVDGRLSPSRLTRRLFSEFDSSAEIVRFAGAALPSDFGALAPHVTEAARQDDPVGTRIMREGAGEIARSLRQLGWQPGHAICLTGGIGRLYRPYLPDDMLGCITAPEGEPLDGALQLARDFAKEIDNERG